MSPHPWSSPLAPIEAGEGPALICCFWIISELLRSIITTQSLHLLPPARSVGKFCPAKVTRIFWWKSLLLFSRVGVGV